MSEPIVEQPTPAQGDAEIQPTEPIEPAEQPTPEVDWKAKSREWEKRAKENKAAADELAALRESQKLDAEKLVKSERARVAAEKGVPADLLVGETAEALEASADALVVFRGTATPKPPAPPAAGQGNVGASIAPPDIDSRIAEAQRSGDMSLAMRLTNQKLVALAAERNPS